MKLTLLFFLAMILLSDTKIKMISTNPLKLTNNSIVAYVNGEFVSVSLDNLVLDTSTTPNPTLRIKSSLEVEIH